MSINKQKDIYKHKKSFKDTSELNRSNAEEKGKEKSDIKSENIPRKNPVTPQADKNDIKKAS